MDNEIKNTETMDAIVTSENVNKEDEEDETYVDLSNSGLTIVPATLFKKHEITKLDLSQNNIRNLPQEICQCINLKSLNLSKNGFRCTNENDTVILPKTLIKLVNLEYLNLAECSLMAIPNIVWTLTTLKYLDLSRNKIIVLSGSVGNLDNLVWLSCQHAGLSGIPLEIVGCRKLEILLLYGNQITEQLPTVLSDLPNLKEMAVNIRDMSDNFTNQKKTESQPDDDQSASVNDDNDDDVNTQALLKSGQIRSEHISATLFQLPALKTLNLGHCCLNYLRNFILHNQLTNLDISNNYFKELPAESLFTLSQLTCLNISHNSLTHIQELPSHVFQRLTHLYIDSNKLEKVHESVFTLPSLEVLSLNCNLLQSISFPTEISADNWTLRSLFVKQNLIKNIPNIINRYKGLENFDLSQNKITQLPVEMSELVNIQQMHAYKGLYRVGLWLLENPIEFPADFNWLTTDPKLLFKCLEKIKLQRIEKRTPIKIVLFGNDEPVKRAFLNQILSSSSTASNSFNNGTSVSDPASTSDDDDDTESSEISITEFITIHQWQSENLIPFTFININPNPIYNLIWSQLIDENSLIWLFISSTDTKFIEKYEKIFDYWLKFIPNNMDIVVQLIYYDKLIDKSDVLKQQMYENIDDNDTVDDVNDEIENQINAYFRKYNLKFIKDTLTFKYHSDNNLSHFIEKLEYNAVNTKIFIEDTYYKLLMDQTILVEKICKQKKCFYIDYDDLINKILEINKSLNEDSIRMCLKILHRQGKILWFDWYDSLSQKIYPFISLFIKSINTLIRNNYDDVLNPNENYLLKAEALLNEERLKVTKEIFLNYGEISLPLYKILTFDLDKCLELKDFLIDSYICFSVSFELIPSDDIYTRPYLIFPQMNKMKFDPISFMNEIIIMIDENSLMKNEVSLLLTCDNDSYISNRIFIKTTCRLNQFCSLRYDWNGFSYLINDFGDAILHHTTNDEVVCISRGFFGSEYTEIEWMTEHLEMIREDMKVQTIDMNIEDYVNQLIV